MSNIVALVEEKEMERMVKHHLHEVSMTFYGGKINESKEDTFPSYVKRESRFDGIVLGDDYLYMCPLIREKTDKPIYHVGFMDSTSFDCIDGRIDLNTQEFDNPTLANLLEPPIHDGTLLGKAGYLLKKGYESVMRE